MKKLVNMESNERVDIGDFKHVAINSPSDQVNELIHNFLVNPDSEFDRFVLSGFGQSNPSGNQLRVEQGRAIVHQRRNGEVVESVLSTSGDTYKIVDMSTYPTGTYYVYIRFDHTPGDPEGRIFWNPSGTGSEYTQTVNTRYVPNWSVRIETDSPGQEWYKIGAVVMPSMTVIDLRNFYFEGHTQLSYQSGWSTEGGGETTDRNSDRGTYGITDLHTFVAATKQCLEDIKGRGLRRWYEKGIGGINLGFDDDPVERALYIESSGFGLTASSSGTYRTLKFTDSTYMRYSTSASDISLRFDNQERLNIDTSLTTLYQAVRIEGENGFTALNIQGSESAIALDVTGEIGYNATAIRGIAKGSGVGVQGVNSGTAGSIALDAYATNGIGLYSYSSGPYPAIEAHGGANGVEGYTNGTTSNGIYGESGSGISAGVKGVGKNNSAYGIWGESSYASGAGVYALNTSSGSSCLCVNSGTGAPLTLQPLAANPASAAEGSLWFVESSPTGPWYLRCYIGGSVRTIASW